MTLQREMNTAAATMYERIPVTEVSPKIIYTQYGLNY
jgi:hypothetical protein